MKRSLWFGVLGWVALGCEASPTPAPVDGGVGAADAGPRCPTEGGAVQPAPRGDGAGAVDPVSGHFFLFGGDTGPTVNCRLASVFAADTWRYDPDCDRWVALTPPLSPSARSRAAYALDTRRRALLVWGGRFRAGDSGNYTLLNDLWSLDLAMGLWTRIETEGEGPSARTNAAGAYDPESDAFYVVGGSTNPSGLSFSPQSDVWRLSLADRRWTRVASNGPTARLFHAVTVSGGALWMYGGGGANAFTGPFFGDVWRLSLGDAPAWSRVTLSGDTESLGNRITAGLFDAGGRVLVVAGHDDGTLGNRNDVHAIDPGGATTVLAAGDAAGVAGSGFCDFPADFAIVDDTAPERRSAAVYAPDPTRSRALVYGGKTDCGSAGDLWSVSLTTGAWRSLRSTQDGLSCLRSGRMDCAGLCQ